MLEIKKVLLGTLLTISGAVLIIGVLIGITTWHTRGVGIHPIRKSAVYIAGELCTINAELSRTVDELEEDFEECAKHHKRWQETKVE